jgi:hypothetical protein
MTREMNKPSKAKLVLAVTVHRLIDVKTAPAKAK